MDGKADEAARLAPGNGNNDIICCFRPEKPGSSLWTEGMECLLLIRKNSLRPVRAKADGCYFVLWMGKMTPKMVGPALVATEPPMR